MNGIATGVEFVWAFVLMLGVLVTVHEFGHYIVARWCGVRVLKFSIGFGNPIGFGRFRLAWRRGGTDYVVAWIPLGGFVKLLGENPGEEDAPEARADRAHSLPAQPTWKKLAILAAGPGMNLLLPVVVFAAVLFFGVQRPEPVVGFVEPGSPAEAAGIAASDRIVSVDGDPVTWWTDVEERVRARPAESLVLGVEREGVARSVTIVAARRSGLDVFQQEQQVGWVGLQHSRQRAILGVPRSDAPAAAAGLRSGDRVVAVDGAAVEDWSGFARAYAAASGEAELRVARGEEGKDETLALRVPALGEVTALGVMPAALLAQDVTPGMPAEQAGLRKGDLILAIDGRPASSVLWFIETVRASSGRPLRIQFARGGETREITVAAKKSKPPEDELGEEIYLIGLAPAQVLLPGAVGTERIRNPLVSVPRAAAISWDMTVTFLEGFRRILSGEVSRSSIGGPIEIARQSHRAFQQGWESFLSLLVLISINLGILNLLPIPVLDGGQALIAIAEGVRGGALPLRVREAVQQVGLVLLLGLMGFAFWNDISKLVERLL